MGIQNWSEDIILVDLPPEPELGDELQTATEAARDRGDCEMVIDFSNVDIITSSSLSKLLKLRKLVGDCGHRLVFCSVAPATKGIFTITGLDGIFEIVDDKFVALASLQMGASEASLRPAQTAMTGAALVEWVTKIARGSDTRHLLAARPNEGP
jgi:anti-anti-sigma factor